MLVWFDMFVCVHTGSNNSCSRVTHFVTICVKCCNRNHRYSIKVMHSIISCKIVLIRPCSQHWGRWHLDPVTSDPGPSAWTFKYKQHPLRLTQTGTRKPPQLVTCRLGIGLQHTASSLFKLSKIDAKPVQVSHSVVILCYVSNILICCSVPTYYSPSLPGREKNQVILSQFARIVQIAQLSQRDRAAGYVNLADISGNKWK